ncbi:MAG: mechanosensitive ion channel family protein [Sulfurovum sp.]|nr:mechanosensitive ion channel family protein [Sulfurovum sp.]
MPLDVNTSTQQIVEKIPQEVNTIDHSILWKIQGSLDPLYTKYPFLTKMILGIPLANLITATIVFILVLLLREFFTYIILTLLYKIAAYTKTIYDDRIIAALKQPLRFLFIIIAVHLFLLLSYKETFFIKNLLNSMLVYTLFWAILNMIEVLRGLLYRATSFLNPDLSIEMGNFLLTLLKILIGGIGLATILTVWNINVTALIASLGLGGLAFALAAKDTASNLFGSFALLADKSIRIGEWIKVSNVEGVVEDIGMRTTKIRSFQKTLITVPNQLIANQPIENFSRRGIRRIKMYVGLTYSTTSKQIIKIKEEIETMLKNHKGISQEDMPMIYFDSFGGSSLNIFIYAFTVTTNWGRYLEIREDIHLKIMQIVESNDSSFAFPSQSIYVESLPAPIQRPVKD